MSTNVSSPLKIAIGFAGAVVVMSLIAGMSMGSFTPQGGDKVAEASSDEQVTVIDHTQRESVKRPAQWFDSDDMPGEDLADDWSAGASPMTSAKDNSARAGNVADTAPDADFGSYNPESRSPAKGADGWRSTRKVGDATIRSRTAPGAPQIRAPGETDSRPSLTMIN